jgi:hypothetical protein
MGGKEFLHLRKIGRPLTSPEISIHGEAKGWC